MPGPSALATASRYLVFAVLIAVMLVKPVLAFASEAGELTPSAATALQHDSDRHADGQPQHDPDGCGDSRWHLSHCCAMQAALLPRIDLGLLALHRAGAAGAFHRVRADPDRGAVPPTHLRLIRCRPRAGPG
ncbi:hypothetical protein [Lysobacter gummosus]|uniref:hypothetical protein n=1 Tax=Lysobacter gummosus TaxID=262324 RepID=UPI003631338E